MQHRDERMLVESNKMALSCTQDYSPKREYNLVLFWEQSYPLNILLRQVYSKPCAAPYSAAYFFMNLPARLPIPKSGAVPVREVCHHLV